MEEFKPLPFQQQDATNVPSILENRSSKPPPKGKHKLSNKRFGASKKTRPNTFPSPAQKESVSYAKQHTPHSGGVRMAPTDLCQISVGCSGIQIMCQLLFQQMCDQDEKMTSKLSLLQLRYVTTMAYINRLVNVAQKYGYLRSIPEVQELHEACDNIQLPGPLLKYIEAIGSYELPNGTMVYPFCGKYREIFPKNNVAQISPGQILREADRPVPQDHWRIDSQWIVEWNSRTGRPKRIGMHFGTVNSSPEGRVEMVVSSLPQNGNVRNPLSERTIPMSPVNALGSEAELGAIYNYRNYEDRKHWLPGVQDLLFGAYEGASLSIFEAWNKIVTRSFVSRAEV